MSETRKDGESNWPPELAEFPSDISETAVDVADRIAWAMPNIEEMRFRIAEAVLAERERCAKIAEKIATDVRGGSERIVAGKIAGSILRGVD